LVLMSSKRDVTTAIIILKGEPSEMRNLIDFRLAPRCKSDRRSCWDCTQRRLVIPYRRFGKVYMPSPNVCTEFPNLRYVKSEKSTRYQLWRLFDNLLHFVFLCPTTNGEGRQIFNFSHAALHLQNNGKVGHVEWRYCSTHS
jgi:hypothetical protein